VKPPVQARTRLRSDDAAFAALTLVFCLVFGMLFGRLDTFGLSPGKVAILPVALLFLLAAGWFSLVRPLVAFGAAFVLLGVVNFQPAPVDAFFALLIATTVATVRTRPNIPAFVGVPLAAFALLTILSITNAVDLKRAISFEGITLYMIILGVWLSWAFAKSRWVRVGMKMYLVGAIVSAVLGPLALYGHLSSALVYDNTRAMGFFKDPNVYGAFLVPAAIFLLDEISEPKLLEWRRRTVIVLFAVVSLGVVVSYSRAAWLNYALAVLTLVFVQANRRGGLRRAARSIGILVACGLAGFAVLAATGSLSFLLERSHLQTYDQQRFSNQDVAFSDMFRHVLGFGPGQTEILRPLSTHSSFVRAAFEQGFLGLAMLVLVLLSTLICAIRLARNRVEVNGVGTGALLGIWLGQVANGFFIDTLHWRHLWVFAALIWCSYTLMERQSAEDDAPLSQSLPRGEPGVPRLVTTRQVR
jgi:O-Antigen ligase